MITFTRQSPGVYDAATDQWTAPAATTISGEGILVSGDPTEFAAQGLVLENTPVIAFTPSGYPLKAFTPEFVLPGDSVPINGVTMTVRKVLKVVAPDGFVVFSKIAVSA